MIRIKLNFGNIRSFIVRRYFHFEQQVFPLLYSFFVVIAHNLIEMRDTTFAWNVAILIVDANNRRFCFDFSSNHSFSFR